MMTLKEIKGVGGMLTSFLFLFGMCFKSIAGRKLLKVYVQGQLSDLQRENCEAIALVGQRRFFRSSNPKRQRGNELGTFPR